MIGWINCSVQAFITSKFGEDAWNKVVAESGVTDYTWVSSCPYPDKVTYDLVVTAARILGVTVNQALEAYGVFFIEYVTEQGYTKLLKTLGSNIVELLRNLNNLHLHLTNGQPAMNAPAFRVENVTPTTCHLHYQSKRPGLWPIVVGALKGLSKEYLHFDLVVTLLSSREQGDDHEIFLVEYPPQTLENDSPLLIATQGAAARASSGEIPSGPISLGRPGFSLSAEEFAAYFPFHILLDKQCQVLQYGNALNKMVPGMSVGKNLWELVKLRHPHTDLTWEGVVRETASSYVLQVPGSGLELKGQMIPTSQPIPGCPVPRAVMLFLGSPRVANLDDMMKFGLFLSDIPLHDLSGDFVLLAEQRQAEADLKEKFEKLTLDLKAEKARSDALVQRMSGLIACFPFRGGGRTTTHSLAGDKSKLDLEAEASSAPGKLISTTIHDADERFGRMEVIEAVRRTLNSMNLKQTEDDHIQILQPIGEGTYGKVYRGLWQQSEVAIKTVVLPVGMSTAQKREKMAIMEAAISSSLCHPNIVQTYTYTIQPLKNLPPSSTTATGDSHADASQTMGATATMGGTKGTGSINGYEVRLVLELCEKGSLRDAVEQGAFAVEDDTSGQLCLNYAAVLETAMDVAKACMHLHRNNVLHCDLKARNVLLRGSGGSGRGVTAKVSDFGLAMKLPEDGTTFHDGVFQGTLTHCAPEVLTIGRVSKASDVYAFGVTLWELYTGDSALKGVPKALLAHQVSVEHRRPVFAPTTPVKYKQLAEWCWSKDAPLRPTFEEILSSLISMRSELGGATPPLRPFAPGFMTAIQSADGTAAGTTAGALPPHPDAVRLRDTHSNSQVASPISPSARLQPVLAAPQDQGHSVSFQASDSDDDSRCYQEEYLDESD